MMLFVLGVIIGGFLVALAIVYIANNAIKEIIGKHLW